MLFVAGALAAGNIVLLLLLLRSQRGQYRPVGTRPVRKGGGGSSPSPRRPSLATSGKLREYEDGRITKQVVGYGPLVIRRR